MSNKIRNISRYRNVLFRNRLLKQLNNGYSSFDRYDIDIKDRSKAFYNFQKIILNKKNQYVDFEIMYNNIIGTNNDRDGSSRYKQ